MSCSHRHWPGHIPCLWHPSFLYGMTYQSHCRCHVAGGRLHIVYCSYFLRFCDYYFCVMVRKIPSMCYRQTCVLGGYPSAYGLFDCHSESESGENALISYGILQPLFTQTASCLILPSLYSCPASTSSKSNVSIKVCNAGLRSTILARTICGVSSIRRKSAISNPASRCLSVAIFSNRSEQVTRLQME